MRNLSNPIIEATPEVSRHMPIKEHLVTLGLKDLSQTTQLLPAGRISHFGENWEVITKDPWVLNAVKGVEIEFSQYPRQARRPSPYQTTSKEKAIMASEVTTLLQKGAIRVVDPTKAQDGFYSNLFLVPKKDGQMRPVINLKNLNLNVAAQHFKMEGMHTLRETLKPGDWLTKVDLKDAYFNIPIAPEHQKFLRFSQENKDYQFTCLPFGLSSAPWVFTKTLRPLVGTLRERGVRLIQYIDDILIMSETKDLAVEHTAATTYLLQNLGFIIHPTKSQLSPSQELEFLGMMVNTLTMTLRVPGEKIKKIRLEAQSLLKSDKITARMVSRVVGKMSAMTQAIPPAPLFFRALQRDLGRTLEAGDQCYETPCHLSQASREELTWWITHLEVWNGKNIVVNQPDYVIESDASLTGWGVESDNSL